MFVVLLQILWLQPVYWDFYLWGMFWWQLDGVFFLVLLCKHLLHVTSGYWAFINLGYMAKERRRIKFNRELFTCPSRLHNLTLNKLNSDTHFTVLNSAHRQLLVILSFWFQSVMSNDLKASSIKTAFKYKTFFYKWRIVFVAYQYCSVNCQKKKYFVEVQLLFTTGLNVNQCKLD